MPVDPGSNSAPAGNYYVNLITGTIQQQTNPLLARALMLAGYTGPFATIADAKAAFNAAKGAAATGLAGGVPAGASVTAGSLSSSILGPLFQANIWRRAGEVLAGIVLLAIGLNAMLKGRPLAMVTSAAGAAGKVVP